MQLRAAQIRAISSDIKWLNHQLNTNLWKLKKETDAEKIEKINATLQKLRNQKQELLSNKISLLQNLFTK